MGCVIVHQPTARIIGAGHNETSEAFNVRNVSVSAPKPCFPVFALQVTSTFWSRSLGHRIPYTSVFPGTTIIAQSEGPRTWCERRAELTELLGRP